MQWIDQQIAEAKLDRRVEKYLKTMVVEQSSRDRSRRRSASVAITAQFLDSTSLPWEGRKCSSSL
jgi:hypothetical protein